MGEKTIPFTTHEGFHSASFVKHLISMQKVVRAGNVVLLDEKNPQIRNIRDGTMIKLDVNSGVYTMNMWACLDENRSNFQLVGAVSGQTAVARLVRPTTVCRGEQGENHSR